MKTSKYLAVFFTFIAFNTINCEETNIRTSASSEVPQPIQRRYSEAILASDYSRSVDNMLKKNFVDWLLGRREKKSDNFSDFGKRQVDFQIPDFTMDTDSMEGAEGNKKFLPWVLKYKQMSSAQNNVNTAVCQQTLDLLMAMDLCNARFP
ncbi:glucagon-1-like [Hyla sarda]|uniref:glucagon-1-like n=1 Tax=Hyla sarda TaxID=327740 RepID=UPI0024C38B37|nr:glucagon-1-like [Hyla sarda]XP_056404537.1 glucagon-1-like [Hyla sarda]XP_056404538.1 glucagon-1-like [Hyla sarda]XP_056404539.1 glucagon-1-like [Hyla sarda]XP_056404540.1 glucagon-1-like [Hyla sarda]XP_056404541.1 glucagon-1-like [Hyla sarda]XP_056404542.1 glucagon-1-like [Hyla sarda]